MKPAMFSVRAKAHVRGARKSNLAGAGLATAAAMIGVTFGVLTFGMTSPAEALPSFARQTGQPCGACHTDFPSLTPFGRRFKIGGYTLGGGNYRTTLFPDWTDEKKEALASFAKKMKSDAGKKSDTATDGQQDTSNVWVPPISMMTIVGYTHTQAPIEDSTPYKSNNNVVVAPVSLFYGGAVTEHIGAFAQVTYNNAPFGAPDPQDPNATHLWSWDNVDVRYANTAKLGTVDVIYGITGNNNPTVQDPWNTTPAWGFPFAGSTIAPGPGASTLIDGTLAAHVAGAGAYAFVNDMLYMELSGYRTVNYNALNKLGINPFDAPGTIDGIAPYWRIAMEPHWGNHWLEFGAFGMSARVHPWNQGLTDPNGFFQNVTFAETDRYTDTAVDAQYQYQGDNYWVTLRGSYIHENQTLDASSVNSGSNPTNSMNTLKLLGSLAYGDDNRIVLTGQYFDTRGTSDPNFYAGDSNGYIAEIAYIPFVNSQAPVWPWANMRVGLQYTYYNKFDGDTVLAHDNNTLFGYIWFAM